MVDMNSDSKFVQVQRVLRPGGRYLCVTLAQKHVIGVLLETLRQGWEICLHQVSEASRDPSSPFQPFLVVATKTNSADIPLVTLLTGDVPHANVMQVIFLSVSLCVCLCLSSLT
jgi:hypothetical protein